MNQLPRLRKKLWRLFSEYVRRRDDGQCFTCDTKKHWKQMHAGHFYDSSISNPELNFHQRNVHCQCPKCNMFKSGNKAVYSYKLELRYGHGILQELMRIKRMGIVKWSRLNYEEEISYYKNKLQEMP